CLFQIVIAFLGVFLAPALAHKNSKENIKGNHGENSHHPLADTAVGIGSDKHSDVWKTVWDVKTGYIATKVFTKKTCIISKADTRFFPANKQFPAPPQGDKVSSPQHLPPREHRYIISKTRLHNFRPYGERIQSLCRGIPSYFAYPAPG
ncbi:GKN1 protein, partial [Anseranas semipalmata]|nr:GKN1 protein [Anseranas semipalmata]